MKNTKKIMAALMAMAMCVSFAACNKDTEGDTSTAENTSSDIVENTSSEDSVVSENSVADDNSAEIPSNPYNSYSPEEMEEFGFSYDADGNVVDLDGNIIVSIEDGKMYEKDEENSSNGDVLFPISDEIKNASLSDGLVQIGDDVFQNGGYMTFGEFAAKYSTENGGDWDVPGLMELLKTELNYELSEEDLSHFPYNWKVYDEENHIKMNLYCTEPVAGTGTVSDLVIVMFEYDVNSYNPETQDKYVKSEVLRVAGQTKNVESGDDVTAFYAEQGLKEAEAEYDDNFFYDNFLCEENAGKYAKHIFEGNQDETIFGVVKGSKPNLYGYEPVFLYYGFKSLGINNVQYKDGCTVR